MLASDPHSTQPHLQHLWALNTLALALLSGPDQRQILHLLANHLSALLSLSALQILLYQPYSQTLSVALWRGFKFPPTEHQPLHLMEEGSAARALRERRLLITEATEAEPTPWPGEEFQRGYTLPLNEAGVLELFQCSEAPLTPAELDFAQTSAMLACRALEQAAHLAVLEKSNLELGLGAEAALQGWARSLDLRSKETEGHTLRVTELTLRLARALKVSDRDLQSIRQGALLHDIGKAGLPENLLLKAGLFTEEEWRLMCRHPVIAYELLYPIPSLRAAIDIPYCHHERWDGTGYPRGLKGEQIPLAARIFAVADVWDALQSDRPYRPGQVERQVRQYIRANAGKHFDPAVVDAFLELTRAGAG